MNGYFARIASRGIGTLSKGTLLPPKSSLWAATASEGDSFLQDDQASMATWPDSFDGTPVPQPMSHARTQPSPHPQHEASLLPSVESPGQKVAPSPPSPIDQHPSSIYQEEAYKGPPAVPPAQEPPISLTPPPPPKIELTLSKETLEREQQFPSTADQPAMPPSPEKMEPEPPATPSLTLHPRPIPLMSRVPRVMGSTEGIIESTLPSLPLQPQNRPVVEKATPASPAALSPTPPVQEQPHQPGTKVEARVRTQDQGVNTTPLSAAPTPLLPSPAPVKNPLPRAHPQGGAKSSLIIGKITVEVVEPAKPSVVVQASPKPKSRPSTNRKPHTRPDSNLKYGLGQL